MPWVPCACGSWSRTKSGRGESTQKPTKLLVKGQTTRYHLWNCFHTHRAIVLKTPWTRSEDHDPWRRIGNLSRVFLRSCITPPVRNRVIMVTRGTVLAYHSLCSLGNISKMFPKLGARTLPVTIPGNAYMVPKCSPQIVKDQRSWIVSFFSFHLSVSSPPSLCFQR